MTTEDCLRWIIENFEGKLYTDDPVDAGGATKFGITLRTLQHCRRIWQHNPALVVTKAEVRELTLEEAIRCGLEVFAEEGQLAEIADWRVRLSCLDYAFHSGTPRAVQALQAAVGVATDGQIGPQTLAAVAHWLDDPRILALRILSARQTFMIDLIARRPSQVKYARGWWRRTVTLQSMLLTA